MRCAAGYQATAGEISGQALPPKPAAAPEEKSAPSAASTSGNASFNDFKIDMNA